MSSFAFQEWRHARGRRLDELDEAHAAVGSRRAGRRYATEQLDHAYVIAVASQFQGFCRDLHSEAADVVAQAIGSASVMTAIDSEAITDIVLMALTRNRRLDRGNANSASIGADFRAFDLDILDAAGTLHTRTASRLRALEQLNVWRNAIVHQDFDLSRRQLAVVDGRRSVGLAEARALRVACDQLAATLDDVLARHLAPIIGVRPW